MTNKIFSMVDGKRIGIASNLTSRLHRPDSVSSPCRCRVLTILLLCLTLFVGVGNAWGAKKSVTYTISSKTTVTTTGNAPTGSSASFSQTYSTASQATSGNSFTLTLNNFNVNVTKFTFSMHSNSSQGKGNLSYKVDSNSETFLVGSSSSSQTAFNTWGDNTTFGSSYRNVNWTVDFTPSSSLVIYIRCVGQNSIYIQSYTLEYEEANLDPASITLSEAGSTNEVNGKYVGENYTLPTSVSATCGDKVFVGWSSVEINTPVNTKPNASSFHEPGETVILTADQTFYAVYADSGGETEETVEATYSSASGWTSSTCGSSYWIFCGSSSLSSPSFDDLSKITNIAFKMRTNGGTSYNKIKIQTDGNTQIGSISTSDGTTWVDKSLASTDFANTLSGSGKIVFTNGGSNSTSGGPSINNIVITYSTSSYTNYTTTCCTPLGSINGSVS